MKVCDAKNKTKIYTIFFSNFLKHGNYFVFSLFFFISVDTLLVLCASILPLRLILVNQPLYNPLIFSVLVPFWTTLYATDSMLRYFIKFFLYNVTFHMHQENTYLSKYYQYVAVSAIKMNLNSFSFYHDYQCLHYSVQVSAVANVMWVAVIVSVTYSWSWCPTCRQRRLHSWKTLKSKKTHIWNINTRTF